MRICNEPSAASLWPPSFFSFGSFLSYQHFICELNEAKTAGRLAHNARQRKQCHFNRIKEAYETRRRVSCFFTSLCSNNCTRDASCLWYNSEAHPRAVTPFLPSYNMSSTLDTTTVLCSCSSPYRQIGVSLQPQSWACDSHVLAIELALRCCTRHHAQNVRDIKLLVASAGRQSARVTRELYKSASSTNITASPTLWLSSTPCPRHVPPSRDC